MGATAAIFAFTDAIAKLKFGCFGQVLAVLYWWSVLPHRRQPPASAFIFQLKFGCFGQVLAVLYWWSVPPHRRQADFYRLASLS